MNPGRILLLFIGAVAAVLVIAAFVATRDKDRPTQTEYAAAVVGARDRLSDALSLTTQSTTPQQVFNRLRVTGEVAHEAADDLDELGTPEKYEEEGAQLVAALRYFGDELDATADALDDFRENVVTKLQGLEFKGYTRVQRALRQLRGDGIDVPLLTGY